MSTADAKPDPIDAYRYRLKARVRSYLADKKMRQKDLAKVLDLTPAAVSANLHADMPMSEGFLVSLGTRVPEFHDVLVEYFGLKGSAPLSAGMESYAEGSRRAAARKRSAAEKIERIRRAEKALHEAVTVMANVAIKEIDAG